MHKLQKLYNSEINFTISTFWDGGFDWKLGDTLNEFKASGCADTFDEAVDDLCNAARKFYPNSAFVSKRLNRKINRQVMVSLALGG